MGSGFKFDMEHLQSVLFGAPLYKHQKKAKAAVSEIVKRPELSQSREIEMLVQSGAIYPRVQRRLYQERDNG